LLPFARTKKIIIFNKKTMNYFYITGTSKGLGKSLAEKLLSDKNNFVYGLSRTQIINHKNYKHISMDLSKLDEVEKFDFDLPSDAKKVILINNAGIIGEIKKVGDRTTQDIISTFNINTTAPSILMNSFIAKFQNQDIEKIILNISSGAGRHTIESWAAYCASKSALDMYSQVIYDEQKHFKKETAVKIYSVAPGIVDTPMQDQIRLADKSDFPIVDNFINYKKTGVLSSTSEISEILINFLKNSQKYKNVIYDVREL